MRSTRSRLKNNISLYARHRPGVDNVLADFLSRPELHGSTDIVGAWATAHPLVVLSLICCVPCLQSAVRQRARQAVLDFSQGYVLTTNTVRSYKSQYAAFLRICTMYGIDYGQPLPEADLCCNTRRIHHRQVYSRNSKNDRHCTEVMRERREVQVVGLSCLTLTQRCPKRPCGASGIPPPVPTVGGIPPPAPTVGGIPPTAKSHLQLVTIMLVPRLYHACTMLVPCLYHACTTLYQPCTIP